MIRKPRVAGSFYPSDAVELKKTLLKFFDGAAVPTIQSVGIVVPHAGYGFSGQTAAYAYKSLPEKRTFVIIGPSHGQTTTPVATMKGGAWETPLGNVAVDGVLAEKIKAASDGVRDDERDEHSVEVQLPFLKYKFPDCNIVPLVISHAYSDYDSCRGLGKSLASVLDADRHHIIATSDLTHYGRSYGYVPFGPHAVEKAKEADGKIIRSILSLDTKGLYELAEETSSTMCGVAAVATAMEACKRMGARGGRILHYSNSYDVTGEEDAMVGYASMTLER